MSGGDIPVRVVRKTVEAIDIASFELAPLDSRALPSFAAGCHIDVRVRPDLTRQYSLCNHPGETHRYVIGVLRDPQTRGGSRFMHDEVHEGGVLHIGAPKNHFPLVLDAPYSLLFAGGIGVTPLLAMAAKLSEAGAIFKMHYCTRSRARTAFIPGIAASSFGANVQLHFDDGSQDERLDIARVLSRARVGTHLYVCGPSGFMDAVLSAARALSWPEQRIHFEYFAADAQQNVRSDEFEVLAARSGTLVHVGKDQTALQALAEAGIDVPTSCEQGMCGTCVTTVIEGVPDHRDIFLSLEQRARNDLFIPCCSRAKSARLVLDL